MDRAQMAELARDIAKTHNLFPELVLAICEQESSWDPLAYRYEPEFLVRYIKPMNLPQTESIMRATSWGLMQTMGQVARERGFTGKFFTALCDPPTGIEYGCRVLESKLADHGGNVTAALFAYNGGSNADYANQVLTKANYYKNSGSAA